MAISVKDAEQITMRECAEALGRIDEKQSEALVDAILDAEQVFFVGVGRVLLSLQAICKRLAHLGIMTPALSV